MKKILGLFLLGVLLSALAFYGLYTSKEGYAVEKLEAASMGCILLTVGTGILWMFFITLLEESVEEYFWIRPIFYGVFFGLLVHGMCGMYIAKS